MGDPSIIDVYSQPQTGGELQYFVGKQYGSGWLRTLGRIAFPILKRVGRFLGNTAEDVLVNEKPVVESLKRRAIDEVGDILPNMFNKPKRQKVINKSNSSGTVFAKK